MSISAAEIMTTPAIVVARDTGLADIASLLASRKISAVPVCDAAGNLLGIVSEADILKPFRESIREKRDWWLGAIAEGEDLPPAFLDYIRQDRRTAADVMVSPVVTAETQTTLPRLAELMIRFGINRLPVLDDGRVVGIVSRSDLIRSVAGAASLDV